MNSTHSLSLSKKEGYQKQPQVNRWILSVSTHTQHNDHKQYIVFIWWQPYYLTHAGFLSSGRLSQKFVLSGHHSRFVCVDDGGIVPPQFFHQLKKANKQNLPLHTEWKYSSCCWFLSVPQLKLWDSLNVEWEGRVCNHFPTPVCILSYIIRAKTNFTLSPIHSSHMSSNHKLPKNHKISPDTIYI